MVPVEDSILKGGRVLVKLNGLQERSLLAEDYEIGEGNREGCFTV